MISNRLALFSTVAVACTIEYNAANSIYDAAASATDFSTLTTAIDAAGLAETLSGDGTFTIFAPPNTAFDKVPEDLLNKLLDPIWKPQLKDVLLYHGLASVVTSADLIDGMAPPTLNGETITINLEPPRVNVISKILIEDNLYDIEVDNGIIHAIDTLLTPHSMFANVVDIAIGNEELSTLVAAVSAAGLVDALAGEGPFTVFAPTDEAFGNLPAGTIDSLLLPENIDLLKDILLYHVVPVNVPSSDLSNGDVETLNGDSVEVNISNKGVNVNDAKVIDPDIIASNGIVHIIDTVLLPQTEPPEPTEMLTAKPTKMPTKKPKNMPTNKPTMKRPKSGKNYSKASKSSKGGKSYKVSKSSKTSKSSKSYKPQTIYHHNHYSWYKPYNPYKWNSWNKWSTSSKSSSKSGKSSKKAKRTRRGPFYY